MANKITEPYWRAWLNWHLYRRRTSDPWLFERYATMWTFRQLVERSGEGGLMIDCGANVGDASMMLLRRGFTVHAFEPDPVASAELAQRLGANPRLTIHKQAVGAIAQLAKFYYSASDDPHQAIFSSLFRRADRHGRDVDVEVVDLFAFIRGLGRRVDILKLDIEGAEIEILERLLREGSPGEIGHIFVELHEDVPNARERIADIRARIAEQKMNNLHLGWA
jgi:FkbM family methyltransferase